MFPRKREEGLIIHELGEETLIYDLKRHRAYSLNRTAAIIWRYCNGQTPRAQMKELLSRELGRDIEDWVLELALLRLDRAHLLQWDGSKGEAINPVRRHALKRVGKLAVAGSLSALLPIVRAVVAPTAAQATTGVTREQCRDFPPGQCPNLPCTDRPGRRCLPSGGRNKSCDCRR
jgi:hypothetical protein